jgi:hypothetical protein
MGVVDVSRRHYQRLFERAGEQNHPADELVEQMPDVRAADKATRALAAEVGKAEPAMRAPERWAEYEDAQFHQRTLREERFFDVGFEMGLVAGLAEAREASVGLEVESLRRQVHEIVVASSLPPARVAAVLLDAARALVLGGGSAKTGSGRTED